MFKKLSILWVVVSLLSLGACDSSRRQAEAVRQQAASQGEQVLKELPKVPMQRQQPGVVVVLVPKQVRQRQKQLKDMGYLKGKVDGIIGPQTRQAIQDYQRKQNLAATGNFDAETLSKLSQQAGTQK